MAQVYFNVQSQGVLAVRLDPSEVRGDGSSARPILRLPLELQIQPAGSEQGPVHYVLLRMAGVLRTKGAETLAQFEAGPMAEPSSANAYYRYFHTDVPLDFARLRRLEELRSGEDPFFSLSLSGLVWFPNGASFEKVTSQGELQFRVPRSTWADQVLPRWELSSVKLIEIRFPSNITGDNFRTAYAKVEAAERLFANGQWKQTLGELYSAFEGLAKSLNCTKPDQQFFAALLSGLHPVKKETVKLALDGFCDLLHLGRHEPKESADTFVVSPSDARFALVMAHAIFEYITPQG